VHLYHWYGDLMMFHMCSHTQQKRLRDFKLPIFLVTKKWPSQTPISNLTLEKWLTPILTSECRIDHAPNVNPGPGVPLPYLLEVNEVNLQYREYVPFSWGRWMQDPSARVNINQIEWSILSTLLVTLTQYKSIIASYCITADCGQLSFLCNV